MKTLIFEGRKQIKSISPNLALNVVSEKKDYLHSLETGDLIEYFDSLTQYWKSSGISQKMNYSKNLLNFFSKKSLTTNLKISFRGKINAMDKFVDLSHPEILYHAQPRGLCVQWLAGNTPIIGLFSIFAATLTKNVTIAKASNKGYQDLVYLLSTMKQVNTNKINGTKLLGSIALLLADRSEKSIQKNLSMAADVRIAWGGKEAIETITNLPKSAFCEDIIMGPKYSLAIVDNQTLKNNLKRVAQRLAIDVSVFDQYACSSPHTVFVEQRKKDEALKFAYELATQMDKVEKTLLPKNKIDAGAATKILEARSFYELRSKVIVPSGTKWTVIYDDKSADLFAGCSSRVIVVKPIKKIKDISRFIDRNKQTLGIGMTNKNKLSHLDKITLEGIDRCPNLGYMTFYEIPWDGMFILDRLVRWVSIHKNEI